MWCTYKVSAIKLEFLLLTKLNDKFEKSFKILIKFSLIWYMGGLSECNFRRVFLDLHVALFSCIRIDDYTHFSIFIFLRLVQYLFQFLGYKKLPYTKLTQMLLGFCRTWPFCYSCFRTRVTASKASPLLFLSPLKKQESAFLMWHRNTKIRARKCPFENWVDSELLLD